MPAVMHKVVAPKIAIFVPNLGGGGAERVIVTLANGFADRGLRVDLVLAQRTGPYLELVSNDVRVIDLHADRVIKAIPTLVRYLRTDKPNALLSALSHANVVAIIAARLANACTRVIVSDRVSYLGFLRHHRTLSDKIIRGAMRIFYPMADGIVTVAQEMVYELTRYVGVPRAKVRAIWNPVVDAQLLDKAELPPEFWPTSLNERRVVLGAGRLSEQKDFATLIEAFAQVRQQVDASLVIIGEGELRGELEALVAAHGLANDVFLPGFISNPFALMRRADLFVLSSRFEGLPGTLIQAMACGTKVVSTDCPTGPREILEDGKWGELVKVEDVSALANAITAALHSDDAPDVVSRAQDFGIDRAIDDYLAILLPEWRGVEVSETGTETVD